MENDSELDLSGTPIQLLCTISFLIHPLDGGHTYTLSYPIPEKFQITLESRDLVKEIIKTLIDHYLILNSKDIIILDHQLHQVLDALDLKESPHTGKDFLDALFAKFENKKSKNKSDNEIVAPKYDYVKSSSSIVSRVSQSDRDSIFEIPRESSKNRLSVLNLNKQESGGSEADEEIDNEIEDMYELSQKDKDDSIHNSERKETPKSKHEQPIQDAKNENQNEFEDSEIEEEFEEQEISNDWSPQESKGGYKF